MSIYQYKSDADELAIHPAAGRKDACFMSITETETERDAGIYIPNADVPTVAAELLKAAGQESVIVPKSTAEVVVVGNGVLECGDGPERAYGGESHNPNWLRNKAANCIAMAQYIEAKVAREAAKKAEAEAAEKKLTERRDALATELFCLDVKFEELGEKSVVRPAINRIIELQDKLDGASRD